MYIDTVLDIDMHACMHIRILTYVSACVRMRIPNSILAPGGTIKIKF